MKVFIIVYFLLSSFLCFAENKPSKYFQLYNGNKISFQKFDHISNDTIYFVYDNMVKHLTVDVIEKIYINHGPKPVTGAALGFFLGAVTGAVIGASVSEKNLELEGALLGGTLGSITGTIVGIAIGNKHQSGIDFNFKDSTIEERKKIIPILLKNE